MDVDDDYMEIDDVGHDLLAGDLALDDDDEA